MDMLSSRAQTPGKWSLSTNCADWATSQARYIGIDVPSNLTTMGYTDPSKVTEWLDSIKS